ncbi:MAG TPA: hypothetical protein V6D27_00805 [Vampirovibrionales bacterium]
MAISILAGRPASPLAPLSNSAWVRNEDIPCTIVIDDTGTAGNNLDLSNSTLKFIVKESTTPASPPLHEYTSDAAGGILVISKSSDKILATCNINRSHLASLAASTEFKLEAQLAISAGAEPVFSILQIATFTSKIPV